MNKSKWSLKALTTLERIMGASTWPLPRSCLWVRAQLCPLCSASLPTLEITVFPKSQVFPWQFPWPCWNGSGIGEDRREGGGRAKRRNERDPENAGGWRKGSLFRLLETCLSSSCKSGIVCRYPTTLNYTVFKSHSRLTFPKCHV